MAITLITSGALAAAATNGSSVDMLLPSANMQSGDVVVLFGGHSPRASTSVGPMTASYTSVITDQTSTHWDVSWKRMPHTNSIDARVAGHGTNNTADAAAYGFFVLRGVVGSGSVLDNSATNVGPVNSVPNCGSITTLTDGSWVLALSGNNVNDNSPGTVTSYSNTINAAGNDTGVDFSTAGATRELLTATVGEDPAAWSSFAQGSSFSTTVAMKPEPAAAVTDGMFTVRFASPLLNSIN